MLTCLDFASLDNRTAHFLSCSFGVAAVSECYEAKSLHSKQTNKHSEQKRSCNLVGQMASTTRHKTTGRQLDSIVFAAWLTRSVKYPSNSKNVDEYL